VKRRARRRGGQKEPRWPPLWRVSRYPVAAADWSSANDAVCQGSPATAGAVIAGRRTYDLVNGWNGSHPAGAPVFVLTHWVPQQVAAGATTDGIVNALMEARAVARGQDVYVIGGAHIAQAYLRSGLLDELVIHLVPVLLGGGIRLFDNLAPDRIELDADGGHRGARRGAPSIQLLEEMLR
jgi:dihydrofolate reductase